MRSRLPLLVILVNVFLDLLSFGVVIPLLPFYAESLGATPFLVGLLLTAYSTAQLIFSPIWGRLSDRVGRRPVILGSLLGSATSFVILANAHTLFWLYASRVMAGIATANIATSQAYIADTTSGPGRARGMGLVGAAIGAGFIFGPAIGGLLAPFGYAVPFYAAGGLCLLDFGMGLFLLPESVTADRRQQSRQIRWRDLGGLVRLPEMALLLGLSFMVGFAFANMEAMTALYTERQFGFTARQNGYLFTYIGVLTVVNQAVLVGPLVARFGERRLVVVGLAAMALGMGMLPASAALGGFLIGVAVLAFGSGVSNPSFASLVSRCTPPQYQGGIMGVLQGLGSLARLVGPLWGGYLFGRVGPRWPYLSAAAFMALSAVVAVRLLLPRREPPCEVEPPPSPPGTGLG